MFNRTIDDLIPKVSNKKHQILRYLQKNFIQNVHFIQTPHTRLINDGEKCGRGGHNRNDIFMTDEVFELVENSYNFRNRNIANMSKNIKVIKIIAPIETQTIGFIENTYKDCIETIRQFKINTYCVDLYFPQYKIIVECDEFGHNDRDPTYESNRENYLISLGNTMIRYNPNEDDFNLSNVLNQINRLIIRPTI